MIEIDFKATRGKFVLEIKFSAPDTGVTALFGRSGSGKTTTLNAIAGLIKPDKGKIRIGGRTLFDSETGVDIATENRRLGYVFQNARLFPHMSVRQNLLYGHHNVKTPKPTYWEALDLLDLQSMVDRKPQSLSGGEQQRVAIGRALLANPRILLMDEPLASLDTARRYEILPYLSRLRQILDIPIIYVSHQMDEVITLADTTVLFSDGRILTQGPSQEIANRPELRSFTDNQDAGSLLTCKIAQQDTNYGLTKLHFSGGEIWVSKLDMPLSSKVNLRILPRDVGLSLSPPTQTSITNIIPGVIEKINVESIAYVDVFLKTGKEKILARITQRSSSNLRLKEGMTVYALIKSAAVDRITLERPKSANEF